MPEESEPCPVDAEEEADLGVSTTRRLKKKTLPSSRRFVRNPDLLAYWDATGLVVKDLNGKSDIDATPEVLFILDRFGRPRTPQSVVEALSEYEAASVRAAIRALRNLRLLLPVGEARRRKIASESLEGERRLGAVPRGLARHDVHLRSVQGRGGLPDPDRGASEARAIQALFGAGATAAPLEEPRRATDRHR